MRTATSTGDPSSLFRPLPPPPHLLPTRPDDFHEPYELNGIFGRVPDEATAFRCRLDEIISRTDQMERRVGTVSRFFAERQQGLQISRGGAFIAKEKPGPHRRYADADRKEVGCSKRMTELMRQFGTILRNISQHKYAWPFMEPVDVEGLGLHDYYKVIQKPMDLGTIKKRMEIKDGTGYKNVREIYSDVVLVFRNAMAYNSKGHDVHDMAKVMLEKFEEKWQPLLPKVIEEERKQKEKVSQAHDHRISQELSFVKLAKDTDLELNELSSRLEELKRMVVTKCRKISTEEKRKIAAAFAILPSEEIPKALDVIAQLNPEFCPTDENIELDIDALDELTLWSLKFRIDGMLEQQAKNSANRSQDDNTKRKRQICDALAKTAKKRSKKLAAS